MVSLDDVQSSNSRIASTLPPGLVAVFVGGTGGIGEFTLKQFAKHVRQPRVYFVGRTQKAGERVAAECKALNVEGEFIFVKADTSLLRTVDDVCRDIKRKEKAVNLLFLTTGTMVLKTETPEGLHLAAALPHYSRARFIVNLLPLLQHGTSLRRVVTVFTGGKEGPIDVTDLQGWKLSMMYSRGHLSSMVTLSLEMLARKAPDVAFIHSFPGSVKTNLANNTTGLMWTLAKAVSKLLGPLIYIPAQECGERQLFLATSAKYPAGESAGRDASSGVPLAGGVSVARGNSGEDGSGVYSTRSDGGSAGPKVEELLAQLRKEGVLEKVWEHTEGEFVRITGLGAV
ncbi:MAG: hypothetical protein M1833_003640 [Piccolia ochrophora]|nr:MAG: hypothetical protein M1833_003640 [Piccolia ochrophora]